MCTYDCKNERELQNMANELSSGTGMFLIVGKILLLEKLFHLLIRKLL